MPELDSIQDIERAANLVLEELSREFRLDGESAVLSASIGIAFYPDHGEDTGKLISSADKAMYDAKNSGRNRHLISTD